MLESYATRSASRVCVTSWRAAPRCRSTPRSTSHSPTNGRASCSSSDQAWWASRRRARRVRAASTAPIGLGLAARDRVDAGRSVSCSPGTTGHPSRRRLQPTPGPHESDDTDTLSTVVAPLAHERRCFRAGVVGQVHRGGLPRSVRCGCWRRCRPDRRFRAHPWLYAMVSLRRCVPWRLPASRMTSTVANGFDRRGTGRRDCHMKSAVGSQTRRSPWSFE